MRSDKSPMMRRLWGALVLMAVALPIPAFADGRGWLLPESISAQGDETDLLFWVIFVVTGVVFVLTEGALLYFIFKYRARPGQRAFHTHGSHKLEVIWTIVPAIILAILAIVQTGTWLNIKTLGAADKVAAEEGSLTVHVLAQQYAWKFRYPGTDGKFGTADDFQSGALHVPQDTKIVLRMRTLDVLHSLYMPNLRFKQDLVPGLEMHGWFSAYKSGKYPIVCAELCGPQHYTMRAEMNIYPVDQWAAKMAELTPVGTIDYESEQENLRFWPVK